MKRILFILAFLCVLDFAAMAQGTPPLRVKEADGSPNKLGITTIVVSNGSLTISGNTATITTGGGGGGITVGTTAIASGAAGRFLYETSGNVLGEVSTLTSDGTIVTFSPTVTTGTGATSGLNANANSLTTGDAFNFASSSVSSGNVMKIAATGTAAASNTKTALNVATSGANATSTQTTYGAQIANTSTGTSSTNIALNLSVSGGSTNYALQVNNSINWSGTAISLRTGGGEVIFADSSNWIIKATQTQFNNGNTILRSPSSGNTVFGAADAASPVAQTLSVQNVVGGTTNTAGSTTTLRGSLGSSQGAPGRIHLQGGALIAASGTTQQTAVDRIISGATKVLTNNSATTIVNVTAATETNAAGVIDYTVEVLDGTDVQYEVGSVAYGVSNKGGVFSGNTATKFGNHQNATSGTLTVTFAISGANPALLSVNANSSLTPSTGYPRITYTLRNLTQQAVAVQ